MRVRVSLRCCVDELLNGEDFATLAEAQVIVEAWRVEYNTERPHSALGGLTPVEYARCAARSDPRVPPGREHAEPIGVLGRSGRRATAWLAEAGSGQGVRVALPLGSWWGTGPCG